MNRIMINNTFFNLEKNGYFFNYILKYKDYKLNYNLNDFINFINNNIFVMKNNNCGIIAFRDKNKVETYVTSILYFDTYTSIELCTLFENIIVNYTQNLTVKELNNLSIVIKVWIYINITVERIEAAAQLQFDKKLDKMRQIIHKIIDYKISCHIGNKEYSRYWVELILNKELKKVLFIKVKDVIRQEECLKHLLNFISKKWAWPNLNFVLFRDIICNIIKKYQDVFDFNDAWFERFETLKASDFV